MKDDKKTKKELIQELQDLRARVSVLEAPESDLKVKLEALQESDRRYRALSANPLTLLYVYDAQGVFHDANDSALELLGYTRDELGQVSFGDIVHPEDYVKVLERQSEELSGGRPEGPLELRLIAKSGEQVWVEAYGYALGGEGEEWRALGVAHDITDRKRMEESLDDERRRLRQHFDNLPLLAYNISLDGKILDCNHMVVETLGYDSKEELIGKTVLDTIYAPSSREKARGLLGKWRNEGKLRNEEIQIITKQGETLDVLLNVDMIFGLGGKPIHSLSTQLDITDRNQAEDALRRSEERYRLLADNVTDVIWTGDMNLRTTYISPSIIHQRGYTVEEAMAQTIHDMMPPDCVESMAETLTEGLAADEAGQGPPEGRRRVEAELYCKDGSTIWAEVHGGWLRDSEGKIVGILGVTRDITDRKQAEEALRESEERYHGLFEKAPASITVVDVSGCVVDCNPATEAQTGYSREEIIGKSFEELLTLDPKDLPMVRKKHEMHLQGQEIVEPYELEVLRKDGERIMIAVRSALLAKDDLITGIQIFATDITERKRMEEALRESEERHRLFFESSPIGIIHYTNEGVITAVNDGAVDIFGSSRDKLIGLAIKEIPHIGLADAVFKSLNGEAGYFEGEYTSYTGGKTSMIKNSSIPIIRDGEVIAGVGMIENITERKQAEEALRESEERFRALTEYASDGVSVVDADGTVVYESSSLERILGHEAASQIGGNVFDLVHPEDQALADEAFQSILSNPRERLTMVFRIRDAEGSWHWMECTGRNLLDDPVVGGMVINYHDVTERKKAEQALQLYSEQLEEMVEARTKALRDAQEQLVRQERLATLGQLAGSVSHELRNPLGAIKNAAYFLNMALENPDPEVKETLRILETEVAISDRIIGTLLEFARPKPGVWRGLKINDLIQDALSHTTVPENVEVVSQLDESLPEVLGDPDQIGQVFGNIVLNAIQAMTEGGQLVIKSEAPSAEWVSISFADAGGGIPEDRLGKIFEPLFTTKSRGIGLGLTLSKSIVDRHGGTIEVQSKAGKGSTFTVGLPVGAGSGEAREMRSEGDEVMG